VGNGNAVGIDEMEDFKAHEGEDTVVVRGSMHQAVMTVTDFEAWLRYEDCERGPWIDKTPYGSICRCVVRRRDNSIRCYAMRIGDELFED
jgi:hypothetical protein